MKKTLIALFACMLVLTPGFASSKRHHSSSSSSSSDTSSSDSCETGVQKPKIINSSIVEFVIVDLYSDATVPRKVVVRALDAVKEQIEKDFAPIWGVGATFKLLPRGKIPKVTSNTRSIVYLFDQVAVSGSFDGGVADHNIVQPPPNDLDGPQPQFFVAGVPLIPNGTPYIIIPYGDSLNNYGLRRALFGTNASTRRPGFRLVDALSTALGHEVMETLADDFTGLNFLGAYQILTPGPTQTFAYLRETGDPVSWGSFNFYTRMGVKVQNFVTPDYFNPYAAPDTCLDFLGNVPAPFTPFGGSQLGYVINKCGDFDQIELVSQAADPTNVSTLTFPVYSCAPVTNSFDAKAPGKKTRVRKEL